MMFCDLVEQPAFLRGSTPRSGATWSGRTDHVLISWATFLSSRAKTRT